MRENFEKVEREWRTEKKKMAEREKNEVTQRLEAKQRREEELKKKSSAIYEVTDEEAAKLQKEIDEEKYVLPLVSLFIEKPSHLTGISIS